MMNLYVNLCEWQGGSKEGKGPAGLSTLRPTRPLQLCQDVLPQPLAQGSQHRGTRGCRTLIQHIAELGAQPRRGAVHHSEASWARACTGGHGHAQPLLTRKMP